MVSASDATRRPVYTVVMADNQCFTAGFTDSAARWEAESDWYTFADADRRALDLNEAHNIRAIFARIRHLLKIARRDSELEACDALAANTAALLSAARDVLSYSGATPAHPRLHAALESFGGAA